MRRLACTLLTAPGASYAGKSVYVITFYKAQEWALRAALKNAGHPERIAGESGEGGSLRVTTVDQVQGSEADVVILSCTRANERRSIGFVSNPNRLNVAISRARERLIVIGHVGTMTASDKNWQRLHAACTVVTSARHLPPINTH